MKKLNLGTGNDYRQGWVNVDSNKEIKADVYHNLDSYPYPFKDEEFDYILSSHIIEHLDNPLKFTEELKRILKKDGLICIIVPHYTNPMSYTPFHKSYYSYKTINHVINNLKIKEKKLIFTPKYKFMELIANKFPIFYENTPLRIFPAKEIKVILKK